MEPIYGMHLGMVISDNVDPEGRNRVQVWIPHISNTLYTSINSKITNPDFTGKGNVIKDGTLNIKDPSDLNNIDPQILKTLQLTLPWAEYAAPLFGGGSANHNSSTGITSTSNSTTIPGTATPVTPTVPITSPNATPTGDKPADNTGDNQVLNAQKTMGLNSSEAQNAIMAYNTAYQESILHGASPQQASIVASAIVGNIAQDQSIDNGGISTQTQIQALFNEPLFIGANQRSGGFNALLNSSDISSAADTFAKGYLLPTKTTANYSNREKKAVDAYNIFSGSTVDSSLVGTPSDSGIKSITYPAKSSPKMVAGNIGTAGSAVGSFTRPRAGNKVWVFFLGGDPQKPVYFAQAPNAGDIAAAHG